MAERRYRRRGAVLLKDGFRALDGGLTSLQCAAPDGAARFTRPFSFWPARLEFRPADA
jgi:hypothetical protein